jgi:hypothetical protein
MSEFKNFPKEEWEYNQKKGEPAIPTTKISEFDVEDEEGYPVTDEILNRQGYHLMLISDKLYAKGTREKTIVMYDSTFAYDTFTTEVTMDTQVVRRLENVVENSYTTEVPDWDPDFISRYTNIVAPFADAAREAGVAVYAITKGMTPEARADFAAAARADFPLYQADDILLKTIIRSNPGFVLWKDGTILKKWHYKQLPPFEEVQRMYLSDDGN